MELDIIQIQDLLLVLFARQVDIHKPTQPHAIYVQEASTPWQELHPVSSAQKGNIQILKPHLVSHVQQVSFQLQVLHHAVLAQLANVQMLAIQLVVFVSLDLIRLEELKIALFVQLGRFQRPLGLQRLHFVTNVVEAIIQKQGQLSV